MTVSTSLVESIEKFLNLCEKIAGQNFLKIPIELNIDEKEGYIECGNPQWFDNHAYNSISQWILLSIERALWFHYRNMKINIAK